MKKLYEFSALLEFNDVDLIESILAISKLPWPEILLLYWLKIMHEFYIN